ncbi:MAG TPA: diacylglycerol kinase family protein [Micromonosporaceae bacterium]|nr:diacylglycerol kinase family protein [Micromonosporaceae bacterium]
MSTVLLLSLADGCDGTRAPVLACRDALAAGGADVETVTAHSDAEIDAALEREARLVVATAADGQLRAVVRRLVRRYAPAPSQRPADLPENRTVPDLPPIGVLPLDTRGSDDLAARLGLPREPAEVASAVLAGKVRRLDLLRTDAGSVTLDGALLGGADDAGRAVPWHGLIDVDSARLSDGTDPVLACAVVNASGYSTVDGLPLVVGADPADGVVDVAVAIPVVVRRRVRVEVRRARGRAVSVAPRDDVPLLDDGVAGTLARKRSWWVEPEAWAVYIDRCEPA